MHSVQVWFRLTRLFAIATLLSSSFAIFPQKAQAWSWWFNFDDIYDPDISYRDCVEDLLEYDIDSTIIASACAAALEPEEVGDCVETIQDNTEDISPADSLAACRRVRRPEMMAECVVDIDNDLDLVGTEPILVLDSCRRSLLPGRYSECVISISETVGFSAGESMAVCLSAGDRPRDLAPSFIPRLDINEADAPFRFSPIVPE